MIACLYLYTISNRKKNLGKVSFR